MPSGGHRTAVGGTRHLSEGRQSEALGICQRDGSRRHSASVREHFERTLGRPSSQAVTLAVTDGDETDGGGHLGGDELRRQRRRRQVVAARVRVEGAVMVAAEGKLIEAPAARLRMHALNTAQSAVEGRCGRADVEGLWRLWKQRLLKGRVEAVAGGRGFGRAAVDVARGWLERHSACQPRGGDGAPEAVVEHERRRQAQRGRLARVHHHLQRSAQRGPPGHQVWQSSDSVCAFHDGRWTTGAARLPGNQWQSMAINGNQWQVDDRSREAARQSMAINGNQWQSMAGGRQEPRGCPASAQSHLRTLDVRKPNLGRREDVPIHVREEGGLPASGIGVARLDVGRDGGGVGG